MTSSRPLTSGALTLTSFPTAALTKSASIKAPPGQAYLTTCTKPCQFTGGESAREGSASTVSWPLPALAGQTGGGILSSNQSTARSPVTRIPSF